MKLLIKNLRRFLLVQLIIAGVTLSITATNAGAVPCAIPKSDSEIIKIASFNTFGNSLVWGIGGVDYLFHNWNPLKGDVGEVGQKMRGEYMKIIS